VNAGWTSGKVNLPLFGIGDFALGCGEEIWAGTNSSFPARDYREQGANLFSHGLSLVQLLVAVGMLAEASDSGPIVGHSRAAYLGVDTGSRSA
jgi:hypothetical protein